MKDQVVLTLEMPAAEAARLLLRHYLSQIRQAAEAIGSQDDQTSVQGVHDFRVAMRRTQAVLGSFCTWLDESWYKRYDKGCNDWLRSMSKLRDLDVLSARLAAQPADQARLDSEWLEKLDRRRGELRSQCQEAISSKAFLKWMAEHTTALNSDQSARQMHLPMCGKKGTLQLHTLSDCLPGLVYQAAASLTVYRQALPPLSKLPPEISENPELLSGWDDHSNELMHKLRLSAKQSRYMLENMTYIQGIPQQPALLKDFKMLQVCLGDWHDALKACEWGWKIAKKHPDHQPLLAWLSKTQAEKLAARACFDKNWPRFEMKQIHQKAVQLLDSVYEQLNA